MSIDKMQQAVARQLKGRFQFGEFDPNSTGTAAPYANITADAIFSEAHQQLAREGAEQSIVLLYGARFPTGIYIRGCH
jgi:beta-glucosidase-like glycosyl hydrolase